MATTPSKTRKPATPRKPSPAKGSESIKADDKTADKPEQPAERRVLPTVDDEW